MDNYKNPVDRYNLHQKALEEEMFKIGAKFFKEHLWRDASKELPTSYGEPVLCICRNKNKPDGIWLMELINWEGSWDGRTNYEKVLY